LHASIVEASRNQFIRQMADFARSGVIAIALYASSLQERNEAIRFSAAILVAAIDVRDAAAPLTSMIALLAAVYASILHPPCPLASPPHPSEQAPQPRLPVHPHFAYLYRPHRVLALPPDSQLLLPCARIA
ncbi:hypothetical protein OIV53_31140, partial [Burkholderia pseudomallei]|nr:hypothetical protein [Burkholderia pseudomallei]